MTLGFKDAEELEEGMPSCIQYMNYDTGLNFNVMNPEDDVILKMMESIKQN